MTDKLSSRKVTWQKPLKINSELDITTITNFRQIGIRKSRETIQLHAECVLLNKLTKLSQKDIMEQRRIYDGSWVNGSQVAFLYKFRPQKRVQRGLQERLWGAKWTKHDAYSYHPIHVNRLLNNFGEYINALTIPNYLRMAQRLFLISQKKMSVKNDCL